MGDPITPKWVNEEWCDYDYSADKIIPGETYLPLTNVFGGSPGDSDVKWLDWDDANNHWTWKEKPKYTWFLTPDPSADQSFGYLYRSEGADTSNIKPSQLCDPSTYSEHIGVNMCTASYTNTGSDCIIGHKQSSRSYWDKPQEWCLTSSAKDGCVDGRNKSSWARSPRLDGERGPSFCQDINQAWNTNNNEHTILYLDGSQFTVGTGSELEPTPMDMFADYPGGGNAIDPNNYIGCYHGKSSACPTNKDLLDVSQCYVADSAKGYSSWISPNTASACCSLSQSEISKYPQCQNAFNPASVGNKCTPLMNGYCQKYWYFQTGSESVKNTCNNFLQSGSAPSVKSSQDTISNYINNVNRQPSDYISWLLKDKPNSPSSLYYSDNKCTTRPQPNSFDPSDPCTRDDSTDSFFVETMQYLCNTPYTELCAPPATGVCDDTLRYFCQQFDRDDLNTDPTLLDMCGCFLLQSGRTEPYPKPNPNWRDLEGTSQPVSPYYDSPSGDNCDPVCTVSDILQCSGPCTSMMCIIDDVTVNVINSSAGNVTLDQICNNCGDQGCICYMGDVTINDASGDTQAQVEQTCDTCYYFTDSDLSTAVEIDCDTGYIIGPDDPTEPSDEETEGRPWYKHWVVIATLIIVGILVIIGFGIGYYYRHKKVVQPEVEVYDPTDAYYNFDFSDFDFSGYQ